MFSALVFCFHKKFSCDLRSVANGVYKIKSEQCSMPVTLMQTNNQSVV